MNLSVHNSTSQYRDPTSSSQTRIISSVFSAGANDNDDWTQVADFTERRRMQTRIAQRNYRKQEESYTHLKIQTS